MGEVIPHSGLSNKEYTILVLVSKGYTSAEIGKVIHISKETVKTHRAHIMRKLDARNMYHAITIYWRIFGQE